MLMLGHKIPPRRRSAPAEVELILVRKIDRGRARCARRWNRCRDLLLCGRLPRRGVARFFYERFVCDPRASIDELQAALSNRANDGRETFPTKPSCFNQLPDLDVPFDAFRDRTNDVVNPRIRLAPTVVQ